MKIEGLPQVTDIVYFELQPGQSMNWDKSGKKVVIFIPYSGAGILRCEGIRAGRAIKTNNYFINRLDSRYGDKIKIEVLKERKEPLKFAIMTIFPKE